MTWGNYDQKTRYLALSGVMELIGFVIFTPENVFRSISEVSGN